MYSKKHARFVRMLVFAVLVLFSMLHAEFHWEILLEEDFEDLSATGWIPKTSANWRISDDRGSKSYHQWNTNVSGTSNFVNEWSIYDRQTFDNFSFSVMARTAEDLSVNPNADFGLFFHYQDQNNFYYVSFNAHENETVLIQKQSGVEQVLARASTPIIKNTDYFSVSVTSLDGEIYVSAQDLTLFRFFTTTFTEGKLGIGTRDDAVYFDNIIVCEKLATDCDFFADFNSRSLNGWTALDDDHWSLSKKDGSIVCFLTSTSHSMPGENMLGEIITLDNIDAEQFTFECDIKSVEWENDMADLGLVFCYFDEDNYYGVTFNRSAGLSRFFRVKNGVSKVLDECPNALLTDLEWHHVKVHVPGANYYEIYFDDVLVLEQWNGDLVSGKIGFGSQNDMGYFDNLCINGRAGLPIFHEELVLTYPNGGEIFNPGETITVSWLTEGVSNNVMLEYSINGGSTWTTIISSTLNDNQFTWTVPDVNSTNCKLRIKDIDGSPLDASDAPFTITGGEPSSITVIEPNGGEVLYEGSACDVRWSSTGTIQQVNIDVVCNGLSTPLAQNTQNDGYFYWNIPIGAACEQAKIKITNSSDATCFDESDGFFRILPQPGEVTVIPSCNVLWPAGSTHTISWMPAQFASTIKLEYSTNGGSAWTTIVSNLTNQGCYEWTTPAVNSSRCLVKVTDMNNLNTFGESGQFTIGNGLAPYLLVTDIVGENGSVVTANIVMHGNTTPFDAFGFKLSYNPDHMTYLQTAKGALTQDWIQVSGNENSTGIITVGGFNTSALPTNSSGIIASITFEITCAACGECSQSHLGITALSDDATNMTGYCGTFTWGMPCILGDVNMDETITPGDALCAFNIYLNDQVPVGECDTECALYAADANCDGMVTPGDALIIFDHYLSGLPIVCPTAMDMAKSKTNSRIIFADAAALPGSALSVPIVLDQIADLSAFGLEIQFPDQLMDYVGISRSPLTQEWIGLDASMSPNGTLLVGGYHTDAASVDGQAVLAILQFQVKKDASGSGSIGVVQASDDLAYSDVQAGQLGTDVIDMITSFELAQNYPNPFNMSTEIHFAVPEQSHVTIDIYNLTGKKVRTLVNADFEMGRHNVTWDGRDQFGLYVTSGVYVYKMTAGSTTLAKKLMLLK